MMLFWIATAGLVTIALLFVIPPLLQAHAVQPAARDLAIALYRDQVRELDADISSGKLSPEVHTEAKHDLGCRLLEDLSAVPRPTAAAAPGRKITAAIVGVALPLCALGIYLHLGNPSAVGPQKSVAANTQEDPVRRQIAQSIAQLVEQTRKNPADGKGWRTLADSYQALDQYQNAVDAYAKAAALIPDDPDLLASFAEAVAMTKGRNLSGKPMELLHAALKLDPDHQRALALAGASASNDGDYASAIGYWQRLHKTLQPDSENARKVNARIVAARTAAQRAELNQSAGPRREAIAMDATVSLSPVLAEKAAPGEILFVIAQAVGETAMPLAVVRAEVRDLPRTFTLNDSMAMTPARKLSDYSEVMLVARISKSGNASAQRGDLHGVVGPVKVGSGSVKILIDTVVP